MKRYWIILVAALVMLTSCAGAASSSPQYDSMDEGFAVAPGAPMEMEVITESMDDSAGNNSAASSSVEAAQQERLVIKNADLTIIVDDPEVTMATITSLADTLGGHVVSSNTYQAYANNGVRVPEGTITIRVPSESLNNALERIKVDAVEVENENVSGEDVTDRYVDLQSRLKAKKAAEAKLLEIMNQAETTEDTLNVYSQLQVIQSDIEVLTGQINYYKRSAAMSSISVRVIATEKSKPIEIGGWELGETASDAVQYLIDYAQSFTRFMIRFIIFTLPVLITIALPFYLVFLGVRALVRRNRKKKAAKAAVQAAPPAEK
ncbi:MAG: DUF4349 domain-containing protein [Anaerolineae bacterium]|nr:DUF4349 domain-containing protein [Anaerolineae bacterium]MBT7071844.1 DUF4349 domain-containing protein [Anaerolineae bacterium]MBT7325007.1 DUF4349 domain-containing protein [Anaerolineae bacterium]